VSGADTKGRTGIFAVDVKTSAAEPVLLGPERAGVEWPVWSPDGKAVVFLRFRRPNAPPTRLHGVISRELATGKEKVLYAGADHSAGTNMFALSPDAQGLAVRWREKEKSGIRLVPLNGGESRNLFTAEGPYGPQWTTGMIWSRDGRYLLFGQTQTQGDTGPVDLWRVSVASGEALKLGVTLDRIRDLSAHPDGRRFSMTAGPSFNAEVWVMRDFLRNVQASR
jgi:Periplasmic component of the Tol biopolymer transport system